MQIGVHKVHALIDTGASTCICSLRLAKKTKIPIQPLKVGSSKVLISAGGNRMDVLGSILLPIKLNGLTIPFEFAVLENVTHDCIIGVPFLVHSKAEINLSNNTVTFFDDMVAVNVYQKHKTIKNLVC